jgi:C4-type Zn-finger protein
MIQLCPNCGNRGRVTATCRMTRENSHKSVVISTHSCMKCGQGWKSKGRQNESLIGVELDFMHVCKKMVVRVGRHLVRLAAVNAPLQRPLDRQGSILIDRRE